MSGDPELEAMSTVSGALSSLDSETQGRVLKWVAERYGIKLGEANRSTNVRPEKDPAPDNESASSTDMKVTAFTHFAELFSSAGPTAEVDKALVAAYWVQVIQGTDGWVSKTLNTELKNSGHAIGNITRALQANIDARPQLVIQLKKSGSSRQARKTYKVTTEGITYVRGMLNGGER